LLDTDPDAKQSYFYKVVVDQLDDQTETAINSKLFEFLLRQSVSDKSSWDRISNELILLRNPHYLIKILQAMPTSNWSLRDSITWIWANCTIGEFEDALNFPSPTKQEQLNSDADLLRHLTLNKTSALLEIDQSEDNVRTCLASLLEIKAALESTEYPLADDALYLLPNVLGTLSKCYYLLSDYITCLQHVSLAEERGNTSAYVQYVAGNACEKSLDISQALVHWERGLADPNLSDFYRVRLENNLLRVNQHDS